MKKLNYILRVVLALLVVVLAISTVNTLLTENISQWQEISLAIFLLILIGGVLFAIYKGDSFFSYIFCLLVALTIGRLVSTMRFDIPNNTMAADDPLMFAETGPGIPILTYLSVAIFIVLIIQIALVAYKISKDNSSVNYIKDLTLNDWAITFIRIYIGLMFIGHYVGHLFSSPAAFNIYSEYFASVGLPFSSASVILGGVVELAVTIGLAFGLMTRISGLLSLTFLFISVFLGGHFSAGYTWVLPSNGWEFPALWMFASLVFVFAGGGKISMDSYLKNNFELPNIIRKLLV